ncbi:MAG: PadR family transcriptional regulator [Gemmataceae bacterium]|nr:PadR family transcriptional regulator [Gemmataceae bacterium]
MRKRRSNPAYLNGVPELLVLQLLDRRPMYGYELVQAIRAASGCVFEFGEGCIYPILHRLEADGLLKASEQASAGRTRLVYRVTKAGQKQLAEAASAWQKVVATVQQVIQGGSHGQPAMA